MEQVESSEKTLFVGGLPFTTTDTQLEGVFGDYGPIKTCFTVKNKGAKELCRGFGYVIYCTKEDAINAMTNVKTFNGRKLQVAFATKRPTKKMKRKKMNEDEPGNGGTIDKKVKLDDDRSNEANENESLPQATSANRRPTSKGAISVAVRATTLVLAGLTDGVTKKQVYKRCRKVGDVKCVTFPADDRDDHTALVQYSNHQLAKKAVIALDGKIFKGSCLSAVLLMTESKKLSRKTMQRSRLIVRNLKFKCSEETLKDAFSNYGKVIDVHIPMQSGGKRVGCAFVQFGSVFDAKRAIKKLNGREIEGRVVAVDWVVPKAEYEVAKEVVASQSSSVDGSDNDENAAELSTSDTVQCDDDDDVNDDDDDDTGDEISGDEQSDVGSLELGTSGESDIDHDTDTDDDQINDNHQHQKLTKEPLSKKRSNDVSEGRTVFIRNLSFDTDEDDFEEAFAEFGEIVYCKVVVNKQTGLSQGTGFVQFRTTEAAQKCIAEDGKGLFLDGRRLNIVLALPREAANKLQKSDEKSKTDKRNMYLAKEGTLEVEALPKSDLARHKKAAAEKKAKLSNPNYFVSKTRLSIQNLASTVSEKQLRDIFLKAVKDVPAKMKQVKIIRSKDRINSRGIGRSMGYGFVEFSTHEAALQAVRTVTKNPSMFGTIKVPIVEFALENARVIKLRNDRMKRKKQQSLGTSLQHKSSSVVAEKKTVDKHKPKFKKKKISTQL